MLLRLKASTFEHCWQQVTNIRLPVNTLLLDEVSLLNVSVHEEADSAVCSGTSVREKLTGWNKSTTFRLPHIFGNSIQVSQ